MGTVEHIGIKTTHIRSLNGEQIVLSNKDLLESRVLNIQRLRQRRASVMFGLAIDTPVERLRQVPTVVRDIVRQHEILNFDRCHLFRLGASSLDFELVFFVGSPDYNLFMDLQQGVLLEIINKLNQMSVRLFFPAQNRAGALSA